MIGNPNLLEDEAEGEFRMEVEQDNPEVRLRRLWAPKPKAKAKQVVQQSYDASELRPQHVTNKKDRAERAKEREERKAQTQPQPSTRTRLTKARAKLAGAPPEDLREVCACYTWHQEERPCYLHRYGACGEHNEDMALKADEAAWDISRGVFVCAVRF